jgi:hypothetical protein
VSNAGIRFSLAADGTAIFADGAQVVFDRSWLSGGQLYGGSTINLLFSPSAGRTADIDLLCFGDLADADSLAVGQTQRPHA